MVWGVFSNIGINLDCREDSAAGPFKRPLYLSLLTIPKDREEGTKVHAKKVTSDLDTKKGRNGGKKVQSRSDEQQGYVLRNVSSGSFVV